MNNIAYDMEVRFVGLKWAYRTYVIIIIAQIHQIRQQYMITPINSDYTVLCFMTKPCPKISEKCQANNNMKLVMTVVKGVKPPQEYFYHSLVWFIVYEETSVAVVYFIMISSRQYTGVYNPFKPVVIHVVYRGLQFTTLLHTFFFLGSLGPCPWVLGGLPNVQLDQAG